MQKVVEGFIFVSGVSHIIRPRLTLAHDYATRLVPNTYTPSAENKSVGSIDIPQWTSEDQTNTAKPPAGPYRSSLSW